MALGLVSFLVFVTVFAFGRATPLIRKNSQWEGAMVTMQDATAFQNNIEAITEIYRGNETPREHIDHLIIVTGHSILLDKVNYMKDEAWALEPFQKGGQVDSFVQHILRGVEMAKHDERSLLVFSGYRILKSVKLMTEAKHVRLLDPGAKGNRIGILRIIFIAMIEQWTRCFWNVSYPKNTHAIHMKMFYFLCVGFLK